MCRNLDIRQMMLSYKKCPHIYTGGWEVGCNKCVDNKVIVKPKSSPKSMSEIQVPNPSPKFKIQSPEEREWDRGWHYNPTGHPPTTHNFSHLKCQYSDGKKPSMTFLDLLSPSIRPSLIKYLLSRPGLIAGPLHSTPLQINFQSIPRFDPIDS